MVKQQKSIARKSVPVKDLKQTSLRPEKSMHRQNLKLALSSLAYLAGF
jgi:hypothetical protein